MISAIGRILLLVGSCYYSWHKLSTIAQPWSAVFPCLDTVDLRSLIFCQFSLLSLLSLHFAMSKMLYFSQCPTRHGVSIISERPSYTSLNLSAVLFLLLRLEKYSDWHPWPKTANWPILETGRARLIYCSIATFTEWNLRTAATFRKPVTVPGRRTRVRNGTTQRPVHTGNHFRSVSCRLLTPATHAPYQGTKFNSTA